MNTTNTPRPNACPYCGAKYFTVEWECGTTPIIDGDTHRSPLCIEREARQKAEDEVERLRRQLKRAIEIAEQSITFHPSISRFERHEELDQIKATLNPTDK